MCPPLQGRMGVAALLSELDDLGEQKRIKYAPGAPSSEEPAKIMRTQYLKSRII